MYRQESLKHFIEPVTNSELSWLQHGFYVKTTNNSLDILFVASSLCFLFLFPWGENLPRNLLSGESCRDETHLLPKLTLDLSFCFKILPEKHRTGQRESEGKDWRSRGVEGTFPGPF